MSLYTRLNFLERETICIGLAKKQSIRDISRTLGRHPSTISREIVRNSLGPTQYRVIKAQQQSNNRIHSTIRKTRKLDNNELLKQFVISHLNNLWSPEQIAKRLKILYPDNMNMRISHETIYEYLYVLPRGELRNTITQCLRRHHSVRQVRNKDRKKTCAIQDYLSIEERPIEVADRIIPGHWEGDLIAGHNNASAIGTLVERTSRMTFLVPLKHKDATSVRKAFARQFEKIPEALKRTLTYDQGQEMAKHKLFTKSTHIQVYFAHPHSPWERGTNENTNSLIRQFFPKGTDFSKVSINDIKKAQDLLNDRPRKVLNFYTPHEVFNKLISVALES